MLGRCVAGALLGFPLAALLLRLVLHALPDDGAAWIVPALILFFPLWLTLMTLAIATRSTRRACAMFGCANAVAFLMVRALG
ncbi:MAG TPA: hypothetical protein VMA74_00025 [Dyella sp.]|uniref:hypothetical protein n=1 Tax=Dyella sp. TaxID=1869338 RepID=UPI002C4DBCB1|nr:hypothetical protein [Dyella sp.]HUB88090.1 hypothetical protein [Dyella sp.]